MKLAKIALRNIFRNSRRSLLSALAIAIAAMSITFLFALYEGIVKDIRYNAWNFETGQVRIRHQDYDRYEHLNPVQYVVPAYQVVTEQLQKHPQVGAVSPRINIPAMVFLGERQISTFGIGIDFELEQKYQNLESIVVQGRLPIAGAPEAVMAYGLARELDIEIGESATFLTQTRIRGTNAFTLDVVGLAAFGVAALDSRTFLLPIDNAERYLRMSGGATEIFLLASGRNRGLDAASDQKSKELAAAVNTWLEKEGFTDIKATPWMEISAGYVFSSFAAIVYNIVALFFFLLAGTLIINTTMMTINERVHEIGTLSAMGMSRRDLVGLFFTESAFIGIAGSFMGVAAGIILTIPLGQIGLDLGARIDRVDMNISSVIYPVISLRYALWVFVFSSVVSMAVSVFPAGRAARLKPVEALRG